MKVISKFLFLFICSLFYLNSYAITVDFSTQAIGEKIAKDSVQLKGMIYNNKNRVKNIIVNIYDYNTLIKTISVRSSNRFVANLPINTMLTVEISAEGFHTKRFMFDSNVPSDLKAIPKYDFDIDIFKESEIAGVNPSLLDFPVGLVSYHAKKKEFVRNKHYTKRMKKEYLKLWAESQEADRQGKGLE